ncbi:MAG: hypothetical protein R3D70_22635 [Rhizobiaceae bacterium]
MARAMYCQKPGCDRWWPRDPAFEIVCPDCHAPVGSPCRRPSGHTVFAYGVHAARDLAVDAAGKYGLCPTGRCGTYQRVGSATDQPVRPHRLIARLYQ